MKKIYPPPQFPEGSVPLLAHVVPARLGGGKGCWTDPSNTDQTSFDIVGRSVRLEPRTPRQRVPRSWQIT